MKPKFTDVARYRHGYTRAVETDIWATFRRIRREQEAALQRDQANEAEAQVKVVQPFRTRTA